MNKDIPIIPNAIKESIGIVIKPNISIYLVEQGTPETQGLIVCAIIS